MNDNPPNAPNDDFRSNSTPPTPEFDREPATQPQPAGQIVAPDTATNTSDSSPAQEPTTDSQPAPTDRPAVASSKSKPKKPLLITVLVAVLLLLGGGAAAYTLWYQNPDRVVGDAMSNLVSAKHVRTETVISSDSELMPGFVNIKVKNLKIDGAGSKASATGEGEVELTLEFNGRDYTAGAKALFAEDNTLYFQINDVKDLLNKLVTDFGGQELPAETLSKLEGIQNRWVKLPLSELGEDAETATCLIDATKRLAADSKYTEELKKIYHDHKFIKVGDSVGSRDGNLGYEVEIDRDTLRDYVKAAASTSAVDEFKKCPGYEEVDFDEAEDQIDDLDDTASEDTTIEVVVWVSRFGHELKQVDYVITGKNPNSKDVVFKGETKLSYYEVKVTAPSESVDYETWTREVEGAMDVPMVTPSTPQFGQPLDPTSQVET